MSRSKTRLFGRKSLLRRIRRRGVRPTSQRPNLLQHSNKSEWHPSCMINFIVASMEALSRKGYSRLWIDPVKVVLEEDYFDLKLSPQRPVENLQRIVEFHQLGEADNYTVEHWNLSVLRAMVDNYLRSSEGERGRVLRRKYFIDILCLRSMRCVIDGFIECFIIGAKDYTIGYIECYVILRALRVEIDDLR